MKLGIFGLLVLGLLALNTKTAEAQKEGKTTSLFNGKNLNGWIIYGTERWYVDDDGTLVCESGPDEKYGYLGTKKTYKNFDLVAHFNQEADGNSGIFFLSSFDGEDGDSGPKVSGWQAEVAPPGDNTGGIYESYGRGWLIQPTADKGDVKMGEWNEMRVRVYQDTVDTWLNGEHMIHLVDGKIGEASKGQIALQIHAGGGIKVRWKDIKLTKLK